jgi:hypothetical protein
MRHAIFKALVIVLSVVSTANLVLAQDEVSSQNESVTRQKRNKKSKYLQKFSSVNTYTLAEGQHELNAKAEYGGTNFFARYQEGTSYAEIYSQQTGLNASAQYDYGINKNISVGIDMNYKSSSGEMVTYTATSENKSTSEIKGISSINLQSTLGYDLGSAALYTQAVFSPKIGKPSFNENTREGNAYNEQSSLELKTTIALNASAIKYGFNINYNLAFEGEDETITSTQTVNTKVTGGGGYAAGAYVEFSDFSNLNLSATYLNANSKKYTRENGNTWSESPAQQYIMLSSALKVDLGQDFSVVPEATYRTILNKKINNVEYDQVNNYSVVVGLRKAF